MEGVRVNRTRVEEPSILCIKSAVPVLCNLPSNSNSRMTPQFAVYAIAKLENHRSAVSASFVFLLRCMLGFLACLSAALCQTVGDKTIATTGGERRRVTVADSICMTDFAGPFISAPIFSPDYSRFVVVVRKGNLERNTVEYSILLWRTSDASESRRPTVVATFSSSSNRAAVADLRWLNSDTITFLAENPGEERELYKLDVNTNLISRLTQAATSVMAYSMSADGDTTVFGAEQPYRDVFTIKDQQRGFRIGTQSLTALVTGKMHSTDLEMFALKRESGKIVRLKIAWRISSVLFSGLSLSPDGRLLVVPMYVGENAPAKWKEYQSWPPPDHQFVLVHTDTGESEPLIDAPM